MFSVYVTVEKLVSHWNAQIYLLMYTSVHIHIGACTILNLNEMSQVQHRGGYEHKGALLIILYLLGYTKDVKDVARVTPEEGFGIMISQDKVVAEKQSSFPNPNVLIKIWYST